MDRLWAPWRMEFIDDLNSGNMSECFLCDLLNGNNDEKGLVLKRFESSFIVMNRYPYNCGHLLIVPNEHVGKLSDLTSKVRAELMDLTSETVEIIQNELNADGCNAGFNLGKAAGAGLVGHIHLHVVPRWTGDSNFLPILSETKSMPEYLKDTYKRLKPAFDNL